MVLSGCSSSPLSNEPSSDEMVECLEAIVEYEQAIAAFPPIYRAMQEADVLFSNGYVTWDDYKDTQDAVTEAKRAGRSLQKKAFDLLEAGSCPEGTSVPVYAFNECRGVISNGCVPPLDRDTFELPSTKPTLPKSEKQIEYEREQAASCEPSDIDPKYKIANSLWLKKGDDPKRDGYTHFVIKGDSGFCRREKVAGIDRVDAGEWSNDGKTVVTSPGTNKWTFRKNGKELVMPCTKYCDIKNDGKKKFVLVRTGTTN
ncbi:MAG: hypothetical protein K0U42_08080 [Actinomycetia bacterium]|nr:hypothetical protein [Actinomycetes bacterium]